MEVGILRGQPGSRSARDCGPCNPISARQLRLLRIFCPSLYSQFAQLGSEIGDSLRPTFEIFPFFGDASQRPGAISTAWCRTQSWLDYFQGSGSRCSISKTGECPASAGSAGVTIRVTARFRLSRELSRRSALCDRLAQGARRPTRRETLWQENWKARLPS